ncbi:Sas10 C-terminal domain-containing protein [Mycena alexandri]|uniref:Sas10 C-terminal domain-containing protein n=1 Tax=Mycena alexandri TaxID=1745969 RepID=A0AAD6XBP0_9AGAR|nr:Sas10 C-terminal domain-containing protein [Mycena alexandri]
MPRRPRKTAGKARPVNRSDSKIKKWDKASDIPLDEEDEFHASRDKILLEGNELGGDDDGDEDEVFGLDLDDSDDLEDEDVEENETEDIPATKAKSSKGKSKKAKAKSKASSDEDSDEDEAWGRGRSAYYSSNAAQLDSDDEEGNELEEQEAKRLQAKSRDAMADNDFGLDDVVEPMDAPEDSMPAAEPLPQDTKSLIRQLEKTSPETLALARDWEDTAESLTKTRRKIAALESTDPDSLSLGMIHLHYQALLTYTTALAFYLHLRSSEKYTRRPDLLRTHPVLARLLTLKQSLITLEDLDFAASDSEAGSNDDSDDELMDAEQLWKLDRMQGLDEDELAELLDDATPLPEIAEARPKKKRKTSSSTTLPVFDLVEPEFTASTVSQRRSDSSADAYGEATSLQHADAVDKSARRKTLRFHTSKIESASARRQGARNNAVGGDDDIPYRDNRKDNGKLSDKVVKGRGQGGQDLDESEPQPKLPAAEDADGYYELVKRKSKEKKEHKKADYEAAQEAARPDYDIPGADGPRSLTRTILVNKGLTPHRPKSVRNPRVKKREKFRKANMKISSQKAVYKGGLAETGRYDGEKSGISKVVKSVRLG